MITFSPSRFDHGFIRRVEPVVTASSDGLMTVVLAVDRAFSAPLGTPTPDSDGGLW